VERFIALSAKRSIRRNKMAWISKKEVESELMEHVAAIKDIANKKQIKMVIEELKK